MLEKPKFGSGGFTLIELIIVVLVVGIMAIVGIPRMGDIMETSKVAATKEEMRRLKIALVGSAKSGVRGYENDVGSLPSNLTDLVTKPAGVSDWNRFTKTGWNGPYIEDNDGDYLKDSWDVNYIYSAVSRTIKSVGSGDTITINF
ncbi:MAG: hypothetical protein B6D58_00940 [candidate division Zixibacteria bacterium 4484_95]|nr:MAG: hypothetical protein B6D58_00940 [candidate division Zixibacteria bacterium 4484_95]RKX21229.1 MAG: hypothetical protein DRP26_00065 [candidate division Zixibacteria bacterium]